MRHPLTFILLLLLAFALKAQQITLIKENRLAAGPLDSMNHIYQFKITSSQDSGVLLFGYADSAISNFNARYRPVLKALDKNLAVLWTLTLPFQNELGSLSACTGDSSFTYFSYFSSTDKQFRLLKIDANGQIVFNSVYTQSIVGVPLINEIQWKNGKLYAYGGSFFSQSSYSPLILEINAQGVKTRTHLIGQHSGKNYRSAYQCQNLILLDNGDMVCEFPKDDLDSFSILCLNSNFQTKWRKNFKTFIDYRFKFFKQKDLLSFVYVRESELKNYRFIVKAETGELIENTSKSMPFHAVYGTFNLPAYDHNFLNFGNYNTGNGFDYAIDYFNSDSPVITTYSVSSSKRNGISDACVIGKNIVVVSIEFVDKYSSDLNSIWRGVLQVKMFHTELNGWNSKLDQSTLKSHGIAFPNPFSEFLLISKSEALDISSLEIIDSQGRLLPFEWEETSETWRVLSSEWSKGVYIIRNKKTGACLKVVKA